MTSAVTATCFSCGDTSANARGRCTRCGTNVLFAVTQEGLDMEKHLIPSPARPSNGTQRLNDLDNSGPDEYQDDDVARATGGVQAANPAETAIVAESSGQTLDLFTSWRLKTFDLRDELVNQQSTAQEQIQLWRERSATISANLALIERVLKVQDGPSPRPAKEPAAHTSLPSAQRWSRGFDACIECKKVDLPHAAHGRCRSCDSYWRQQQKTV